MDVSNLDMISDEKQRAYLKDFMLPVASKMLSNRLKIKSSGMLPALGSYLDYCTDGGDLTPSNQYRENSIDADFLLIIGGFTQSSNTIAYAYYCLQGIKLSYLFF